MAINMSFTDFVTPVPADWLNNVNTVVNTPNLSNYIAPFTGSVLRTNTSKLADTVSVLDFGADSTGVLDSTTAMQAAHNTGRLVYYPAGSYKFTTITMTSGGIVGDGKGQTILTSTDTTVANLITHTGNSNGNGSGIPLFRDFALYGSGSKTTGAGIILIPASSELKFCNFDNVYFNTLPTPIYFSAASFFTVDKCDFYNYSQQGIRIENSNDNDSGDSSISNCMFNTATPTGSTYGIWYRTSGGLKVVNTKILGGNSGFVQGFTGTKNVADLLINNCSIENTTAFGIFLGRDSGTFNFGTVQISNTELGCPQGIVTDTSGYLTLVSVSGCTINILGTTTASAGIALNNVPNISIGSNILNAQAGGTPQGINITSSCSNGKIGPQTYVGISGTNCLVNASSTVFAQGTKQTGTASVTTSTAYGSLFTGSTTVTFPVPYLQTPDVRIFASGTGAGAISLFPTNISTTGFTMVGIGITSGGVLTNNAWTSEGVI